jgi:hypothetical protein
MYPKTPFMHAHQMLILCSLLREAARPRLQTQGTSRLRILRFQQRSTLVIKPSLEKSELQVATCRMLGTLTTLNTPGPGLYDRALKRSKAYSTIEDVRPTLRNKPSGLKADWHSTVSKPSLPRKQASKSHARSSSSFASSSSSVVPRSPSPEPDYNHISFLLATTPPPIFSRMTSPPLFCGNIVPVIDAKAAKHQDCGHSVVVHIFPHFYIQCDLFSPAFSLATCLQRCSRPNAATRVEEPPLMVARELPQHFHPPDP